MPVRTILVHCYLVLNSDVKVLFSMPTIQNSIYVNFSGIQNLDYLEDARSTVDDRLSMAEIQNGLKALLQTTTKNEDIFDWINVSCSL